MQRKLLGFAVVLPILFLAIGIVRSEIQLARSQRWVFEVAGYDPRDLLRGHYLAYRITFDEGEALDACDAEAGGDCCLCLHATASGVPPKVQRATCARAKESCDGLLQTSYLPALQRYYVPEAKANALAARLMDAERKHKAMLLLAIDRQGRPAVDGLLIDGRRIEGK
jgi:uncharacterized membrane-anchored protein